MNLYGMDYSFFDLGFVDPTLINSISIARRIEEENLIGFSNLISKKKETGKLNHRRHDGTSPLPLGMDWSPPPQAWDGPNTIWPQDFHTGWSYCVTVPSWTISSEPGSLEAAVFYRVQVGLQSPEGVSTTRGVLRRFSDFLKLSSVLKYSFRNRKLPTPPPKRFLTIKSTDILEERRGALEAWMANVLSDIELSRSAPVACFLELEAAARSSFAESGNLLLDVNLICNSDSLDPCLRSSGSSIVPETSALASYSCNNSAYGTPEILSPSPTEAEINETSRRAGDYKWTEHDEHRRFADDVKEKNIYTDASPSFTSHSQDGKLLQTFADVDLTENAEILPYSDLESSSNMLILPTDEQSKLNRILNTMQQRLVTSKTDMDDLIARLNQEIAVKKYLTTKVNDLETELETTKKVGKENLEQAVLIEREGFTQMQWDMEELRGKCIEMELKLKTEEDERDSIIKENESLRKELGSVQEQLKSLKKVHEDSDSRSKADVKLLVKEVKSLRVSQLEQMQEVDKLAKEKAELESKLQMSKQESEQSNRTNANLLHVCEILHSRLEECCVNFLIEEENKLKMEASSFSDAVDILSTSDDRISLVLAEAQLLAQETESSAMNTARDDSETSCDDLRKMLTRVFIDNVTLRKQINSVLHCSLRTAGDKFDISEEDSNSMLAKFLER